MDNINRSKFSSEMEEIEGATESISISQLLDIENNSPRARTFRSIFNECFHFSKFEAYVLAFLIIALIGIQYRPELALNFRNRTAEDIIQNLTMSIDPCDDFYEFACSRWSDNFPDRYGATDWYQWNHIINFGKITRFLRSEAKPSEPKAIRKMRIMYNACMDMNPFTRLWTFFTERKSQIIGKYLKRLDFPYCPEGILAKNAKVSSTIENEWIGSIAKIKNITGLDSIIGFKIITDMRNRSIHAIYFGVPRKVSLLESNENVETNDQNLDVDDIVEKISDLVNYFDLNVISPTEIRSMAEASVKFGIALKRLIKEANDNNVESQPLTLWTHDSFERITNLQFRREYLNQIFNNIQSTTILDEINIATNLMSIIYLQKVMYLISITPQAVVKFYIWSDIVQQFWKLYEKESEMYGLIANEKDCFLKVFDSMPMAAINAIIEPNFMNETKPQLELMAENIRSAFNSSIKHLEWIDSTTKQSILEKSNVMEIFVGAPEWIGEADKLDDFYAGLKFSEASHVENMMNVHLWKSSRQSKASYLIDNRIEWPVEPSIVNAFYIRALNSIYLPFGILKYPFYGLGTDAMNYGAMGSTIGHEFIHAFDNNGRKYDKNGEELDWWKNESISEFEARTKCFIDQYDNYYVPQVNQSINGKLTLGENIADNGGLRLAYYAYKLHINHSEYKEQLLSGVGNFTNDQLFFISFAHRQCELETIKMLQEQLKDKHAPERFRVNGALVNSDEFRNVFNCPANSKMVSRNPCRIW